MTYEAHLQARPRTPHGPAPKGRQPLNVGSNRDSFIYVPPGYDPDHPAPLALLLHGAGGHAGHGIELLEHLAGDAGMILVAPASVSYSWDVIAEGGFGTDVGLIDRALDHVFSRYAVDQEHLAIGGFSDGASYALSLGLVNGNLFTHVMAFSPGFIAPLTPVGQPAIYVSHGVADDVLPIHACSRRIVPRLRRAEYDVVYREFDGGHVIPAEIAREAAGWFLQDA